MLFDKRLDKRRTTSAIIVAAAAVMPNAGAGISAEIKTATAPSNASSTVAKNVARPSSAKPGNANKRSSAASASATAIQTSRSVFATLPPLANVQRLGPGWTGRSTLPPAPPRTLLARIATSTAQPATAQPATAQPANNAAATPQPPVSQVAALPVSVPARVTVLNKPTAVSPRRAMMDAAKSRNSIATDSTSRQAVASQSPERGPASLSSRQKERDQILLAQLASNLRRTQNRLDNASADLSQGQKLLASYGGVLRSAMLEAGPDARGLHPFVRVAQRYAGTPYVWGGESRYGFDCSGFIMVVMRDLGYKALPHSAAEQFNYGKPIAQALLKPGDLVFFANTYKPGISHVGIYLGRRRFIHAAGTGIGTIVSSLDSARFQAHYAGARRLIAAR